MKSTGKRKTPARRRRTTKKKKQLSFRVIFSIIFAFLLALLLGLVIYTLVLFPNIFQKKLKTELQLLYQPYSVLDEQGIFVMKLHSRPNQELQEKVYTHIQNSYGLEVFFEKIKSSEDKGINKLSFFRGIRRFSDTGEVYIYWNQDVVSDLKKKKHIVKNTQNNNFMRPQENPTKTLVTRQKAIAKTQLPENRNEIVKPLVKKENAKASIEVVKKEPSLASSLVQKPVLPLAKLLIIIDDVGYEYKSAMDFMNSALPLTYALIPSLEYSKKYYDIAMKFGYDMILHMPMEPEKGARFVEENAILTTMSGEEIAQRANDFIALYPCVLGANNHMGSKAVKNPYVMQHLLKPIKEHNLIWVDSLTTPDSLALDICAIENVRALKRDVFLDNENTQIYARQAMEQLIHIARQRGYAIGIGHIQSDALLEVLKEYYSKKDALNIRFVGVQEVAK